MRVFVGITDYDWYQFLTARSPLDEVNFWQPSGAVPFHALGPGELFLFKLHAPRHSIVGGGWFAHWSPLPLSMAWDAFREKNGVGSLPEMRQRLGRYRPEARDARAEPIIGCVLLERPFFLPQEQWIQAPADWAPNIVRGKIYDTSSLEGMRLWTVVQALSPEAATETPAADPYGPMIVSERRGQPTLVYPRLGQGTFRVLVTDLYNRRCSVTGERTLPVLEAAHIKPFAEQGPHHPTNGLLLRADLHTLFDRGYVTVTPERRLLVSRRIREEFENGRDYYQLDGRQLPPPNRPEMTPSPEYLDWHASHVFRA